jgi:hypothetical protein
LLIVQGKVQSTKESKQPSDAHQLEYPVSITRTNTLLVTWNAGLQTLLARPSTLLRDEIKKRNVDAHSEVFTLMLSCASLLAFTAPIKLDILFRALR